jgi:hypothetical protein
MRLAGPLSLLVILGILASPGVLALGRIGDADVDPIDKEIRRTLIRMTVHAEAQCQRFALVSLAQMGGRPGADPETAIEGSDEIRRHLLKQIARGKKDTKGWAAISLGVLGHDLVQNGHEANADTNLVLRANMKRARQPEDFAAYALALGMRHDSDALADILKGMEKKKVARTPEAVGNAALAVGMLAERDGIEGLRVVFEESTNSGVRQQVSLGLALLGDRGLCGDLIARVQDQELKDEERVAAAGALSYVADARHLNELVAILGDTEKYDAQTRSFVAAALGQLADEVLLPWNSDLSADINYLAATETLTSPEGTGVIDLR